MNIKRMVKYVIIFILDSLYMIEAAKKYYILCKKDCGFVKDRKKILVSALKNIHNIVFVKCKAKHPVMREGILFKEICKKPDYILMIIQPLFIILTFIY